MEAVMSDEKPIVVPVEEAGVIYNVTEHGNTLTIDFEGSPIPSLPGIRYGLALRPGTTKKQAEDLAAILQSCAPIMFAGFLERVEDEEWQDWLTEMYDDMGYLDPSRKLGPGDEIRDLFEGQH
jgi:hypothetical protein